MVVKEHGVSEKEVRELARATQVMIVALDYPAVSIRVFGKLFDKQGASAAGILTALRETFSRTNLLYVVDVFVLPSQSDWELIELLPDPSRVSNNLTVRRVTDY